MDDARRSDEIAARYRRSSRSGEAPRDDKGDGMTQPRIGFIGVGHDGPRHGEEPAREGLPAHLHRASRPLAHRRTSLAAGAKEAKTPAELAQLRHRDPLRDRLAAGRGERASARTALSAARAGSLVIDTSTAEPGSTAKSARRSPRRARRFVDAPLARTPKEAEEGRLNTMVGADEADFERVKPVLAAFCENIFHVGPPAPATR
jgi:3-hydroxyisobutyrate dehydrogenase-like beta-hydroxyacid dehydrogenase